MRQAIAAAVFLVATMMAPPDWVVPEELGPGPDDVRLDCSRCI